jgi:hypothetical protein
MTLSDQRCEAARAISRKKETTMLHRFSRLSFAMLLVSLGGCAPGAKQGAGAAAPAGAEFDPKAFYSRELQALPKQPLQFQKLSAEAEIAGSAKFEDSGNSFQVTIPIGTESPVQCFVYKKEVDTGGTLLMVTREAAKKVDVRLFRLDEVSLLGDYPVVFLEAQYLTKTPKGQALGELKSMFYQHPVSPMLCLHDELGYNETFKRMTKTLAASLKIADMQVNPPKFIEVFIEKVGERPTGFSSHVALPEKNGKFAFLSRSTSFIPRSESDLVIRDKASTEVWDPDGKLVKAAYADSESGQLTFSMSIEKVGPSEYSYKGKHDAKEVSGKFKTKSKRGLATNKIVAGLLARELLSGKANELKIEEYHAGVSPEAPVEVSYKTESKEKRLIKMKLGDMEALARSDDKGGLERLEIPVGNVNVVEERVLVRGTP